ncbi:MAG: hypothetical protein ACJAY7_001107 [Pseudohongiellaceae bacterium]|jgi:hypothetical protein
MNSERKIVSLDSIRDTLRSGDLIFFQGREADSVLIRDVTGGIWSHCAMIIKGEDIDCVEHEFLLFESSVTPGKDIHYSDGVTGTKSGVMLVDFDLRMEEYSASECYSMYGVRQLNAGHVHKSGLAPLKAFALNPNIRKSVYPAEHLVAAEYFVARELETAQFSEGAVSKIKNQLQGDTLKKLTDAELRLIISKTIETVQDMIDHSVSDKISHNHDLTSHFFCSELVADALMHMDILSSKNAAAYSPSDFSDEQKSPVDNFYSEVKHVSSKAKAA